MSKNNPRVIGERRAGSAKSARLAMGSWSWVVYESCKLPFILMSIYVLLPYVTRVLIGNFVVGQALWARYAAIGGALAAITLPLLGGSLDRLGPRKPWIAALTTLRVPLLFTLWWATPDGSGVSASAVLLILALVSLLSACSEMMHTALLVPAVGMKRSGRFSGVSLGVANMFSVAVLTFMLWAFILPGKLHWPIIPAAPLFGLDQASHQPERLVGPVAAILLILGTLPVLLFSPDVPRSSVSFLRSIKLGLRDTWQMAWGMRRERSLLTFLIARTLYNDAFLAGLAIAGVYAAGIMRWGPLELLSYGILKAVFAGIGAFIAGEFNAWLGPRRALKLELGLAVTLGLLVLGTTRNEILYFWSFDPQQQRGDLEWAYIPYSSRDRLPRRLAMGCGLRRGLGRFIPCPFGTVDSGQTDGVVFQPAGLHVEHNRLGRAGDDRLGHGLCPIPTSGPPADIRFSVGVAHRPAVRQRGKQVAQRRWARGSSRRGGLMDQLHTTTSNNHLRR